MLTSVFAVLVWSGYNSEIDYVRNPQFPTDFFNLVHGVRAFFPMIAAVIAAGMLARRRSLPKWLGFSPLSLLILYSGLGLTSSIFVSPSPIDAVYWAFQYVSVIIVIMAVASTADPEAHLARFISVNWACCAIICMGLLAGIPLLGGGAATPSAGSPLGVEAYGEVRDVAGMAGPRNTGFGRFAGIVLVVALAKMLHHRHDRKDNKALFMWTLLLLGAGLALFLAQARTSWVSGGVAVIVVLARAPNRWRVPILMLTLISLPLVLLTGLGHGFALYLTREQAFDPTLTGRSTTWADGWQALQHSPWVGLGFWGDRYFLHGQNIHNAFLDALVQGGVLGFVPVLVAIVWVWIGLLRFYATKSGTETSSLPGEILGVMTFFAVYSITEVTFSFYSVGWMAMAPLFAHVQLRAYQNARKHQASRLPLANVRGSPVPRRIAPLPGRELVL
jgi:O-antigen ligase